MLELKNFKTRKSNVTLDITKFPTWEKQAVTGRIKDWMKNSGSRLPVSCTVFVCDDTNIDESFIFTSKALRNAAGVAIHLPENITPINRSFEWRVYLGENCADEYGAASPEIFMEPETHEYVISVADSMESSESLAMSIENSWLAFLNYTGTRPVVVDLSRLRKKGTTNSQGLTASGASSFKAIYSALYAYISDTSLTTLSGVYSTLNQVLRRGGIFKNGAITLHYDYDYPYVSEFLNMTREQVSWAKRALNVDEHLISSRPEILADLIQKMQGGDVWLVKKLYDAKGKRIYLQVCLEIAIKHKATCLLMHGNLGACTIEEIPEVMTEGVEILCRLHAITGVGDSGIYLKPKEDRQIGYGLLGLANLLAIEGVTYAELVDAFSVYFYETALSESLFNSKALKIVEHLAWGYRQGAEIARMYGMERAFCVSKDTWILTDVGARKVSDLIGKQFTAIVDGQPHQSTDAGFYSSGTKDLYNYKFKGGLSIKCTSEHKLLTSEGWKEAGSLQEDDWVILNDNKNFEWAGKGCFEEGWLLGSLLGDGCIHNRGKENRNPYARLQFWGETKEYMLSLALDYLKSLEMFDNVQDQGHLNVAGDTNYVRSTRLAILAEEFGMSSVPNKVITDDIEKASSDFIRGFIRGLFDADGTVTLGSKNGSGRKIVLYQVNPSTLYAVQRMLLRLGIKSTVYKNKSTYSNTLKSGRTISSGNRMYTLTIQSDSILRYAESVGFNEPPKAEKVNQILASYTRGIQPTKFRAEFLESEYIGEEEVYDCTIPTVSQFDANGIKAHNCVAPTATCSYNHVDREGYTTAPEIAPPINRSIERDSATFGVKTYDYHPKTEIAAEVGWETFFKLNSYFQRLMDSTGLGHSISMNWWSDMIYADQKFIQDFLDSPIKSLYYSLPVKPNTQDKSTFAVPSGEIIDFSLFGFDESGESPRTHCTSCSE